MKNQNFTGDFAENTAFSENIVVENGKNLVLEKMYPSHLPKVMKMQETIMAKLPDPRWYFPSDEGEFLESINTGYTYALMEGEKMAAFAMCIPHTLRQDKSYAKKCDLPTEGSYDFCDIMVHPDYRKKGIHSFFLTFFHKLAKKEGGTSIYATCDPENAPSFRNFEKAGYRCFVTKPAYDGRMRRYYCVKL